MYHIDSGLMILSRFPIVDSDFHMFSPGLYDDAEATRGVFYARVKVSDNQFVNLFDLHTQCTSFSEPPEIAVYTQRIRKVSIEELQVFVHDKLQGVREGG